MLIQRLHRVRPLSPNLVNVKIMLKELKLNTSATNIADLFGVSPEDLAIVKSIIGDGTIIATCSSPIDLITEVIEECKKRNLSTQQEVLVCLVTGTIIESVWQSNRITMIEAIDIANIKPIAQA